MHCQWELALFPVQHCPLWAERGTARLCASLNLCQQILLLPQRLVEGGKGSDKRVI